MRIRRLNLAVKNLHTQVAAAQIRSEFGLAMRCHAGARCIQNVLIVPFRNDVNGGESNVKCQMVLVTNVRSEALVA